jgi:hypothetical protein
VVVLVAWLVDEAETWEVVVLTIVEVELAVRFLSVALTLFRYAATTGLLAVDVVLVFGVCGVVVPVVLAEVVAGRLLLSELLIL